MLRHCLLLIFICLLSATAAADPPANGLKVGLLKSMVRDTGPAKMEVLTANFRAVMRERTGLDGDLVTLDNPDAMRHALADGTAQLGAFHGFEFAQQRELAKDLEPVMVTVMGPGARQFVLVVAKSNSAKNVTDLRGAVLAAAPDAAPPESRAFLQKLCKVANGSSGECLSKTYQSKSAEDALDDVVDGQAQATVASRATWTLFERRKPGRAAKLRVLAESEPFPPAVVACLKGRLDADTLKRFRTGMAAAHESSRGARLMGQIKVDRFSPVPADFAARMATILKAYPPG